MVSFQEPLAMPRKFSTILQILRALRHKVNTRMPCHLEVCLQTDCGQTLCVIARTPRGLHTHLLGAVPNHREVILMIVVLDLSLLTLRLVTLLLPVPLLL